MIMKKIAGFYHLLHYSISPGTFFKSNKGKTLLKDWAKDIYAKGNYECAKCGYKAGGKLKLNAHHIYPKGKYPQMAFKLKNGICLCERCHKNYHKVYGNEIGGFEIIKKYIKN